MAKHHADLLVQDIDGVVRRKLVGTAGIDILGPRGMAAAKIIALERAGKVVAGIRLGRQQVLADSAELGNQARRKNGQAHNLDQADVLLLNVVILGMRVENAQRMLVGRDVAAKRQVGLVDLAAGIAAGIDAADDGRHGVVGHAVGCVRDNAHRLIGPLAPGEDNLLGSVEQLSAVMRAQAQHRERPLQHGAADLVKAGHVELRDFGGVHHGELMRATLEVVVRQNRAAHNGQVGVGANEVVREQVHKIEQAGQALAVDVHRTMLGAHGNAVLVKVRVRAVLEAPALAVELDGDNAQILSGGVSAAVGCGGASGIALVFDAELAGGILLARVLGCTCRGDIARVLLRFGQVDGDLQVAPVGGSAPLDVARDGGAAHVTGVTAQAVEPVGRGARLVDAHTSVELLVYNRRPRHERAHDAHGDAVAARRRVLGSTVGNGGLGKHGKCALQVKVGECIGVQERNLLGLERPSHVECGTRGADALQNGVVCPDAIVLADHRSVDSVLDQVLRGLAHVSHYSHAA